MDTKHALLDTAETLARSRGFDAFSYADLSASVGIRKASIHHHFPAKADLALALIERYAERFRRDLTALDAAASAAARLGGFLDLYRSALQGGTQLCLCVAFSAGRDSFAPAVTDALATFHADNIAWLTRTFTLAQTDGSIKSVSDPGAEAMATQALVEGGQLLARAALSVTPYDTATSALRARLNQGAEECA